MIGIFILLALIFIVACFTCPGFLTFILIGLGILAVVIIVALIIDKRIHRRDTIEELDPREREKAIVEWERKWGKKHPSRKKQ